MAVAFLIVVFLGVVSFVGWPLLRPSEYAVDSDALSEQRNDLVEEKERLLNEIKDLELTHETGKISTQDFSQMSAAAKRQAASVLKQLDDVDYQLKGKRSNKSKKNKSKKQQKQQQKQQAPSTSQAQPQPGTQPEERVTNFCPKCGSKADQSDAFCRTCGANLKS